MTFTDDASLTVANGASPPIKGVSDLRSYWASTGSFKNHRFSLVPSFKTQIKVIGDRGTLYFECHDVANFDTAPAIVNDTFLGGTLCERCGELAPPSSYGPELRQSEGNRHDVIRAPASSDP